MAFEIGKWYFTFGFVGENRQVPFIWPHLCIRYDKSGMWIFRPADPSFSAEGSEVNMVGIEEANLELMDDLAAAQDFFGRLLASQLEPLGNKGVWPV